MNDLNLNINFISGNRPNSIDSRSPNRAPVQETPNKDPQKPSNNISKMTEDELYLSSLQNSIKEGKSNKYKRTPVKPNKSSTTRESIKKGRNISQNSISSKSRSIIIDSLEEIDNSLNERTPAFCRSFGVTDKNTASHPVESPSRDNKQTGKFSSEMKRNFEEEMRKSKEIEVNDKVEKMKALNQKLKAEINSLKSEHAKRLAESEERIKSLELENKTIKAQLMQEVSTKSPMTVEIENMKALIRDRTEKANKTILKLAEINADLTKKCKGYEERHFDLEVENEKYLQAIQILRQRLNTDSSQNPLKRSTGSFLESVSSVPSLRSSFSVQKSQPMTATNTHEDETRQELQNLVHEIRGMKSQYAQLELEFRAQNEKFMEVTTENKILKQENSAMISRLTDFMNMNSMNAY